MWSILIQTVILYRRKHENIISSSGIPGYSNEFQNLLQNKISLTDTIKEKLNLYKKAEQETKEALFSYALDKKGYFKRALAMYEKTLPLNLSKK